jgi:hypothetical protein
MTEADCSAVLPAAGAEFTDAILRAMNGEKDVTVCTYVESPLVS